MSSDTHLRAAENLASRITFGYQDYIDSLVEVPGVAATNRASSMGDPCLRRLVLDRTKGNEAKPWGSALQAIFEDGNLHEDEVKRILSQRMGIRVHGSGRHFQQNAYGLTGHVDAIYEIMWEGVHCKVGIEIKSVNGWDYEAIRRRGLAAMIETPRLRRWVYQAQAYQFLEGVPVWIFVFKSKATGQLFALVVPEDNDIQQEITDKCVSINAYVAEGTLPGYVNDRTLCRTCKYNPQTCSPPDDAPGMAVLRDAGLAQVADTVVDDGPAAKRHGRALDALKSALEAFLPAGKDGERTVALGKALIYLKLKKGRRTMKVTSLEVKPDGDVEADDSGG